MRIITKRAATFLAILRANPRLAAIALLSFYIVIQSIHTGTFPPAAKTFADQSSVVSVFYDGQKKMFNTDALTVGEVLKTAGVILGPDDRSEPDVKVAVPNGQFSINVFRARPVLVIDGSTAVQTRSSEQSAHRLATDAGLKVYPEDLFQASVITNFVGDASIGEKVIVRRAAPLRLRVDGKTLDIRTQKPTIGEALAEKGIKLGLQDTVSPSTTKSIVPGDLISITRVSEVVTAVDQNIPRETREVPDPNLAKGLSNVKTEGSDGHRRVTYRIHYNDGAEIARETLSVQGEVAPITKVVIVGTKQIFAGSVEHWRPMVTEAAEANGLDPNHMLRIMACESGGDASNYNGRRLGISLQKAIDDDRAIGLFQFKPSTWYATGGNQSNITDGPTQIKLAAFKMSHYGFSAWACK